MDDHQPVGAAASWAQHRAEPFADWPKDDVATADERTLLRGYQRGVLARKAAGVTDAEARRAVRPPVQRADDPRAGAPPRRRRA